MTVFANDSAWKPVKIGAGGWLTGIDIARDGTMVARTDTYGAYIWNGNAWAQLVTVNSMPAGTVPSTGVYEIKIAASNSNIIYMEMAGGIYKTVDKGQHWVKTSFPVSSLDPNGNNRMDGQKLAVDPTNANIVFAGTQHDGLWVTRDGGTTWAKIAAVLQGGNTDDASLTGITIQGSNIFVGTAGSGVFVSHDSGYTWSSIGGPAAVAHAAVATNGTYYASSNGDGALWKFANGSWTKLIDNGVHAVAIDPFDQSHIVVTNNGGSVQESKDGGATWTGWNWANQLESTADVPWLENSGLYMSSGGLVFDPLHQGQLWQSGGVGVWETQLPTNLQWNTPVVWNSHSVGIEQLVANEILAPAGGDPIFASWDRPFFTESNLDSYATSYSGGGFSAGWSLDYASTNSHFVVGISDWWGIEESGYSTDGGQTWHKFAGLPEWALNTIGGNIAASSSTNFLWAASGGVAPAYTLDGGSTWHTITIPGKTDWSGFYSNFYLSRNVITADRVLPNTFYLYDTDGVYRSSDGGVNWGKVYTGQVSDWSYWNAKIEAVPGSAGELFFTSGPQSPDANGNPGLITFMHSHDGGSTWQPVTGVQVVTFGYGAAATAGGPATVFIVGTVNGNFGVFYSSDDAQTWVKIGEHPLGSLDGIKTISGDMDTFGRVYIGFGGSGYAYYDVGTGATVTPSATPDNVVLNGDAQDNVLIGTGTHDHIFGGAGNDTLTGGGVNDGDTLTGGSGNDTFRDSRAGLNGDTITDFTIGDRIVFSDATLAEFSFSLSGNTLTYSGGSLTLTGFSGTLVASTSSTGGVQLAIAPGTAQLTNVDVRNDFNGDGRSDVLWRNASGQVSDWLGQANGGFAVNDANALSARVAPGWTIVGTGDFNGDGRDDILWRHSNGMLSDWLSTPSGGFAVNDANAMVNVPTDWNVIGVGDFNGDGRDDILWRSGGGLLSDWLGQANGSFVANDVNAFSKVQSNWHVVSVADFNGDGRDDILWRSDSGQVSDWLGQSNGGFVNDDAHALTNVPLNWTVVGTGDFNGDGRDDILWRNDQGQLSDWLGVAGGGFINNDANALTSVPLNWSVVAIGDYNGDGRDDILWRNTNGQLSDWLGNANGGFTNNDAHALVSIATSWHVQPDPPLL